MTAGMTAISAAIVLWRMLVRFRFPPCGGRTRPTTAMSDMQQEIDQLVKSHPVVLFMKGTSQFPMCGFSGRAVQVLKACGVKQLHTVNVLEDEAIRQGVKEYANWPTIPQLYVNGEFVGGSDIMMEMYQSGELQQLLGGESA
jgi:monothiol glutaredoxin